LATIWGGTDQSTTGCHHEISIANLLNSFFAKQICKLPHEVANLAYLDYAFACREVIHDKLSKAIGAKVKRQRSFDQFGFSWRRQTNEAPMAYKDINMVMDAQKELVDVVANFMRKIVRMTNDGSRVD
jgi:hypothetical protein